jgi:hypothetical protein
MAESILKRLTNQLRANGLKNASGVAVGLLEKRGQMKNGKLTSEGKTRQAMGRAGRANDRAAKAGGGSPSQYKYNPATNRSKRKK